ncbi:PI-PLC X domain-containing protein At5g67130 isoform X2 [Phalaenopsis equestris]|uniref:PI-PLC X domain-containing protein At5g67130 isoform X2 n=1 Tax=Phalaenopsis equestris TaxID=78828 RepID=UPI0009E3EE97|nr:PI-PLC X domain-containing protein At5g67130 isoform X2 [Phalaenopsis equestris]
MATSPRLLQIFLSSSLISVFSTAAAACATPGCQLLSPCSGAEECAPGLYCGTCPASGKTRPSCTRGQATHSTDIVKNLPFNKYTWLVTHNSFSIVTEPSFTGAQRITFYNQEDSVTNQLRNGVRGLMLDMYDFEGDIWLCHSFQGQCYNFTAFEPAFNTLKEVEAFLTDSPTEIITIFIEDYVRAPKGLSRLFANADLMKYLYPLTEMPANGKDWPTITEMVEKNYRLLVFTSVASKEADEGIAYQWRYVLENEPGDPGIVPGSCPNRRESEPLNSRYASLFLQNYFTTIPVQNDACNEHSSGLTEMVNVCYKAAEKLMPNFLAVNFYMRSDGRGVFDILDRMNGLTLCGCPTVFACKCWICSLGAHLGYAKTSVQALLQIGQVIMEEPMLGMWNFQALFLEPNVSAFWRGTCFTLY